MAGGRPDGEDDAKWTDRNEAVFLNILAERVKKDPNGAPSFKASDWHEFDEEMYLACGERYGSLKLSGKYNRLRVKHRQFSELLEHTGVTYHSGLNVVNAPEDVWQMFFLKHKGFKVFRKKGCPNYEMLGQVFNKSTATGHLHHSSNQLPPTSEEERENEDAFMGYGVHVSRGDGIEGETTATGSSRGKRAMDGNVPGPRRVKKVNSEKWDSCMEQFASSHSAKTEYYAEKAKKYRGEQQEVTSPLRNTESVVNCMEEMDKLDGVSDLSYNKALVQFENPYWRKVFMKLSVERKKSWLLSLE